MLQRVLGAACLHNRATNPAGGYCQGLNSVAACLLTFLSAADTFWMLEHIQESLCIGYYTDTMVMVNVDVAVVDEIVAATLPAAHAALRQVEEADFFNPMHVHVPKWLIPLFATELPSRTLFRLWDLLFTEGSHVLVCASAAVLECISDDLVALTSAASPSSSSSSSDRVDKVQRLFRLGSANAFRKYFLCACRFAVANQRRFGCRRHGGFSGQDPGLHGELSAAADRRHA